MQKILNADKAHAAMAAAGLSQRAVADALGVSREAVSQWLRAQSFPRPNKLLQLGKLLDLSFGELVRVDDPAAPRVAFRKVRGTKTLDHHIEKAQAIGRHLRHLVPYLPFDTLKMPPVLKAPSCDDDYLQYVTAELRVEIGLGPEETVDFKHLIRHFVELQTVLVPVLWGEKARHENAVHIYLPDSQTTWVYLNLDTNVHDFKFWMAHELGHCLAPSLEGDAAEDFADAFAGSLLFPQVLVEAADARIRALSSISERIAAVLKISKDQMISPFTVSKRLEQYAAAISKPAITLGKGFPGAVTNFNKGYPNLSGLLFQGRILDEAGRPDAHECVQRTEEVFQTSFFDVLRRYLIATGKGAGFLEVVLDLSPLDARSLHAELT